MIDELSMREEAIKNKIRLMLESQAAGVLATEAERHPYANLIAFSYSSDLKQIFFATPRDTTKYRNLAKNPNVSLIIDNRSNSTRDFHRTAAITALGKARELSGKDKAKRMDEHAARLPGLGEFVRSPSITMFQIEVERYIIVDGLTDVAVYEP
jgi:nitroimidazol reductase NimA-like FMN-containing flavoprotein (pyridoxamine 5'-phosphate oxidase superfamily)